jgi:hypothetical protein
MAIDENNQFPIVSTLILGALGVTLALYGRRSKPGILTDACATIGYGLIAKSVTSAVIAGLKATEG